MLRPRNRTPTTSAEPVKGRQGRAGNEEPRGAEKRGRTALHSAFYKPRAKGGVTTRKRRAVARILLLYWATGALAMSCQAPGAGNDLSLPSGSTRVFNGGSSTSGMSLHPGPERAQSTVRMPNSNGHSPPPMGPPHEPKCTPGPHTKLLDRPSRDHSSPPLSCHVLANGRGSYQFCMLTRNIPLRDAVELLTSVARPPHHVV